jgi:hypothetical protein
MSRSTRSELLYAFGLAASCAACGESTLLEEPEPAIGEHPCDVGAGLGLTPLFDFELVRSAQFYYFANPDDPEGHTDVVPEGSDPNTSALAEVGRCPGTAAASVYALHVQGGGYVSYGPNIGWTIAESALDALDVSAESGIAFWARTDAASGQTLELVVNDVYTYPVAEPELRHCELETADYVPPLGARCWNGGKSLRVLSQDWRLYTVDFSELVQDTWGTQSPGGTPDLGQVLSVEFHLPVIADFDLWLDDISFFRRP